MSNLTKEQKDILNSIEKEFTKMNEVNDKPFSLISKEFFDKERVTIDKSIKTIQLENDVKKQMVQDMMQRDIKLLNGDIRSMGLVASKYDCSIIRIDVVGDEKTYFPRLTFDYTLSFDRINFSDGRTIRKVKDFNAIEFYVSDSKCERFTNLKVLCEHKSFIDKIRKYYDTAKSRGIVK